MPSFLPLLLLSHMRPPFVEHVGREALKSAVKRAELRHARAVQLALCNYPTHLVVGGGETDAAIAMINNSLTLQEYSIEVPGALADFGDVLPRKVYVTAPEPLFSPEECAHVIQMAEDHFRGREWTTVKSGQHDIAGFTIKDVPTIHEWFVRTVRNKLFPLLVRQFPNFVSDPQDLCVDNPYLVKYTTETGRRTNVHTDQGCLTFTIALNSRSENEGGGTWFEGFENGGILEMDVGQVTIRPGSLKHRGNAIQQGVRYIIGGFCMHRHKPETVRMLIFPTPGATPEERLRDAEAAVALNPHVDLPYNFLADAYLKEGDEAKGIQVLEYCLQHVNPKSEVVAYPLAMRYVDQGKLQKAKQTLDICLEIDEDDIDAMLGLSEICGQLGDRAGIEAYMKRILATSQNANVRESAYYNLGVLYEGTDRELDFYRKSLECVPNNFPTQFALASACFSRKMWHEAVTEFRSAVRAANNDPDSEEKALAGLFRSAMNLIQTRPNPPTSPETMVQLMQEFVGAENYARLGAIGRR